MRYGNVLLLVLSLCFPAIAWAQQEDAPLGDVARRARQAKPLQPHATLLATNAEDEAALPRDPEKLVANACALVTADEVEEVFGVPLPDEPRLQPDLREADLHGRSEGGGSACSYAASWGTSISVEADHTCVKVNQACAPHDRSPACVVPSQSCAQFNLVVHSALVSQNGRDTWREHTDRFPSALPVSGIGDEADRVPGVKGLNLRKGPYFLTIDVSYAPLNRAPSLADQAIERDKELAIAHRIVARLSASAAGDTGLADTAAGSNSGSGSNVAPNEANQELLRKQRQACADLADVVYKEKIDALKEADAPAEAFAQLAKQHQEVIRECQTAPFQSSAQPQQQPDM